MKGPALIQPSLFQKNFKQKLKQKPKGGYEMSANETATRKTVKWYREEGSAILVAEQPQGTKSSFDLARIWPNFLDMTPVQQGMQEYGTKQFLSDKAASAKALGFTEADKAKVWTERFEALVKGELRVNAAGESAKVSLKKMTNNFAKILDPFKLTVLRDAEWKWFTPEQMEILRKYDEGEDQE
jgi:hypothetical protein